MDVPAVREFLRTVRPLARFADEDLGPLAAHLRARHFRAGQILMTEGERGLEMYFVRRGQLAVLKRITGGVEQAVGRVGPGEFVGEMALFDRRPRSASIRAESDVDVLVLDRAAVQALINMSPAAAAAFLRALSEVFIERLRRSNVLVAELTCAVLEATGFRVETWRAA